MALAILLWLPSNLKSFTISRNILIKSDSSLAKLLSEGFFSLNDLSILPFVSLTNKLSKNLTSPPISLFLWLYSYKALTTLLILGLYDNSFLLIWASATENILLNVWIFLEEELLALFTYEPVYHPSLEKFTHNLGSCSI